MGFFADGLQAAIYLILGLDAELFGIVRVSLQVSGSATLLAALLGIPAGLALALSRFRGRRLTITILNSLLAVPTVVIGLVVYAFLSRRGLLGSLGWLYTQQAMVIGQTLLVLPLTAALTLAAVSRVDRRYRQTALTLGANPLQVALVVAREARFAIAAALIASFGRVIAEIGISMMLGGNVRGFTRTMTTAMALEYDKGSFDLALALGLVLLLLSLAINAALQLVQGKASSR